MAVSRFGESSLLVILVFINYWVFVLGVDCDFETSCGWEWKPTESFKVVSAANLGEDGLLTDADGSSDGHFLYHSTNREGKAPIAEITSPWLNDEKEAKCTLQIWLHMYNMINGSVQILLKSLPNVTLESTNIVGSNEKTWKKYTKIIGPLTQSFRLTLEIIHPLGNLPGHVAIDNIRVRNCVEEHNRNDECQYPDYLCPEGKCIPRSKVCDITKDCPGGEDELEECHKIPRAGYCNFEEDTCSWTAIKSSLGSWQRKQGSMSKERKEEPFYDHTYNNATGHYMSASLSQADFGSSIYFNSVTFRAPPRYHSSPASKYFNSCQVRFVYHTVGKHPGELLLNCITMDESHPNGLTMEIFRAYQSVTRRKWFRRVVSIPTNITRSFYLQFAASKGIRANDLAIDDLSLSPECFGIGVDEVLPPLPDENPTTEPPLNKFYHFNTCGSTGPYGPTQKNCSDAYMNTSNDVTVIEGKIPMAGIQKWTVPETGIYTVIVRGASGSRSLHQFKRSRGAIVRGTFNWSSGDVIYILIGQKGTSPQGLLDDGIPRRGSALKFFKQAHNKDIGGSGGGGTFVFKINSHSNYVPLLVAGGGGGFSDRSHGDDIDPDARGYNASISPGNGFSPAGGAGGGGGWNGITPIDRPSAGQSLLEGGHGGVACNSVKDSGGQGGFGGGGGSCISGGGGGGYRGGNAPSPDDSSRNGQGGTSYIEPGTLYTQVELAKHEGDGSVYILPAQQGCGCSYLCVKFDLEAKDFHCICPPGFVLESNGLHCKDDVVLGRHYDRLIPTHHIVLIVLFMAIAVILIIVFIYLGVNRYKKQTRDLSHEPLNNAEVQLNRLRQSGGGMVTEYNPNYEFGGSTCTIQDLPQIPRDHLTLVKALGQGAFGEVYQGYLAGRGSEAEEIPIAVKTLPELSSNQAEMDFLMEALIMSKFNHPNIVRFIGVCFEKMPRFIVLELLPGGDLKSFLRESRPKPHKPSNLSMTDLLNLSLDVAKGCQYLEENHFIHRDIAARNCLLTTKNPGRVVKIADFGMARDIYRADYYRKGGKAMLPVKWMPPEAFLDGIFTTKTDVWSFGVLLWEVMSLGYMPYPGWGNQEVMQLVTSGGRLEPPNNCPNQIYHIMMRCWHPIPDERPNFATIIERLGYCLQDPDVTSAPLPVFHRPPSMERDATVMRPPDSENSCLQIQRPEMLSPGSEDYLIPMPSSNYSLATDNTEIQSSPSLGSVDQLLELDETSGSRKRDTDHSSTRETNLSHPPFDKRGYAPVSVKGSRDRLSSSDSLEALPVAPSVDRSQKGSPNLALDVEALQRQSANQPLRYINVEVSSTDTNPSSSPAYDGVSGINPVA